MAVAAGDQRPRPYLRPPHRSHRRIQLHCQGYSASNGFPSGGFNLYIDDKLVDAISFAKDGTAEHALAGRRVIDARPSRPARGLQPLIRCTRRDLERAQQAYDSAANYYAANTLLLIGVVGATGVVDALTAGWALLPTAAGVAGAYIAWSTSRSDMYSAYDSMVEMNNGGEC